MLMNIRVNCSKGRAEYSVREISSKIEAVLSCRSMNGEPRVPSYVLVESKRE